MHCFMGGKAEADLDLQFDEAIPSPTNMETFVSALQGTG